MRALGVVKGDQIVSEVGRQLLPVIVVENDRPEHKFLAEERLGCGQFLLAAQGAGIVGFVGLRNPAGSGVIVVVENIWGFVATENMQRIYVALVRGATLTQGNTEQPRDTRWQPTGAFGVGAPNIAGQIVTGRSDTIVVTPFVIAEIVGGKRDVATFATVIMAPYPAPIVLGSGDSVLLSISDGIGGSSANLAIQASFTWRERTLEPTET